MKTPVNAFVFKNLKWKYIDPNVFQLNPRKLRYKFVLYQNALHEACVFKNPLKKTTCVGTTH